MTTLKFSPSLQRELDVARWRQNEAAACLFLSGLVAACVLGLVCLGFFVGGL